MKRRVFIVVCRLTSDEIVSVQTGLTPLDLNMDQAMDDPSPEMLDQVVRIYHQCNPGLLDAPLFQILAAVEVPSDYEADGRNTYSSSITLMKPKPKHDMETKHV